MSPISVAIVDDQPLIRVGLRMIVESQPDLVVAGEAADGNEAIALSRAAAPDIMLLDVRMPELDGIGAIAGVLAAHPVVRIIMLTTFAVDDYVFDSLRAGASGYLLKDSVPEAIVGAIRTVSAGSMLLAPEPTRLLIEEFARGSRPADASRTPLSALTERELEVLGEVARGRSNVEIAGTLYVSEGTVKTHVSHILTKLGMRDRVQLVIAAYEFGLIRPGAP